MSNNKVWFITGSSRGFGWIWAETALLRGDTWEKWNDVAVAAQGN